MVSRLDETIILRFFIFRFPEVDINFLMIRLNQLYHA